MSTLYVLLRQRARVAWNQQTRGPRRARRLLGLAIASILGIGFVTVAGFNTGSIVASLARTAPDAPRAALPLLLAAVTSLTLVTSLSTAFHHLFMAGDVELLLAAPLPRGTLFWLKVLETWRDAVHILLFLAAALIGFGLGLHLSVAYFPIALLTGLGLTLGATAAAVVLTLFMARLRFGQSVLGLTRLLSMLLFIPIGVVGLPAFGGRGRVSPFIGQASLQSTAASLVDMPPPPQWAPTTWAAHLLLGEAPVWLWLACLGLVGICVAGLAQVAFQHFHQPAWERVRFGVARGHAPDLVGQAPRGPARRRTGAIPSMLLKDWRTLARDPRWRATALVSLAALGLPVLLLSATDPAPRAPADLRFWIGLFPVPYLAFIFGTQHGAATLTYEGRNIVLLRTAPAGMRRLLAAKFLGGLVLVLGIVLAATLLLVFRRGVAPGWPQLLEALGAATWLAVGATTAAVAGAALTVDFEGDNPQRRVGYLGVLVTSGLTLFFFVANTAALAWVLARSLGGVPRPLLAFTPWLDSGLVLLAAASVGLLVGAALMGARRVLTWEAS